MFLENYLKIWNLLNNINNLKTYKILGNTNLLIVHTMFIKEHSVCSPSSGFGLALHAVRYLHEPFRANFDHLQLGTFLWYRDEIIHV